MYAKYGHCIEMLFICQKLMYKCGSAGWKLWAEIPICSRNTVVGVHGYVRCLNLVTAPVTASPISEALQVTLIPWQSLHTIKVSVLIDCACTNYVDTGEAVGLTETHQSTNEHKWAQMSTSKHKQRPSEHHQVTGACTHTQVHEWVQTSMTKDKSRCRQANTSARTNTQRERWAGVCATTEGAAAMTMG